MQEAARRTPGSSGPKALLAASSLEAQKCTDNYFRTFSFFLKDTLGEKRGFSVKSDDLSFCLTLMVTGAFRPHQQCPRLYLHLAPSRAPG